MNSQTAVFTGAGAPLQVASIPSPALRAGETLVRIRLCTICRSDLHTHAGRRMEPTPTVLGHEIVGEIEAFGPETPRTDAQGGVLSEGERISWPIAVGCGACFYCANDLPQKCERLYKYGHQRITPEAPLCGGLAERIVLAPGTPLYRIPDTVSDRVAAPANCATATVAAVLRMAGPIQGRSVLILGAGMLGLTACAMARAFGASAVIVSDPSPAALERATRFGATHLCADAVSLRETVAQTTAGRGVDAVLELAGALASVEAALSAARIGGTLVLAGSVTPLGTLPLDPEQVVRRMLTLRGVHNYHPDDLATALDFLAGAGFAYPFESLIAAEFPLSEIEAAFVAAHANPGLRIAVTPLHGM